MIDYTRLLLDRLGTGEEQARTAKEIGLNPRHIRSLVNRLRKQGYQICSGDKGYWLAETDEEVERTCRILQSKALDLMKASNAMKRGRIDGQISV